jgi:hypothetical protein
LAAFSSVALRSKMTVKPGESSVPQERYLFTVAFADRLEW